MYSIVLMMALNAGGESLDCHRYACSGGTAYVVVGSSCHGGLFQRRNCSGGTVIIYSCCGGAVATPVVPPKKPEELKKMPEPKKEEMKKEEMKKDLPMPKIGGGGGQVRAGAPARITVSMPADARFTIDNYTSPARSDTHIIVSSPLAANETKTYVLKAEVMREGRLQTMEERITVRGGEEKKVNLILPLTVAAR